MSIHIGIYNVLYVLTMSIKYIGKRNISCDMCQATGKHAYLEDNKWMKGLFPEVEFSDMIICEKCAKREASNKHWKDIKRMEVK